MKTFARKKFVLLVPAALAVPQLWCGDNRHSATQMETTFAEPWQQPRSTRATRARAGRRCQIYRGGFLT